MISIILKVSLAVFMLVGGIIKVSRVPFKLSIGGIINIHYGF